MNNEAPESPGTDPVFFSKELLRGVPLMLITRLLLFVIQFGVSVIVVKTLGKEQYGLLSAGLAIKEFLLVFCSLGLNTALVRFAPELRAKRNRAGLIRLFLKIGLLQLAMVAAGGAVLLIFKSQIDVYYFKVEARWLLLFVILLTGAQMIRTLIEDAFTAVLEVNTVAFLATVQSVAWFSLAIVLLHRFPTAAMGISIQTIAATAFLSIGLVLLVLFFRRIDWQSPSYSVGKRRVLGLSFASMLNSLGIMILQQYSVVFFLTVYYTPDIAGIYRLGCETPLLAISFIPMAMRKLLMAGFAEAYAKDEACLGRLITATYRALIMVVMPLACFGVFFSSKGLVLIYGEEMADAGPVSAIFCVIHVLTLISTPLSMAIVAKEKILNMAPLMALQVAVNLILDVALIPPFGIYGGVAAVALTFLITIPFRLYVVGRIIGGFFFPMWFMIKVTVPLVILAAALYPLAPYLNVWGFFGLGTAYLAVFPVLIRVLGLLREDDVNDLRTMSFKSVNRVLDLLVKP